jgi:hypothetical protein
VLQVCEEVSPSSLSGKFWELAPKIQAKVDEICVRLANDVKGRTRPVTLDNLFASYVADDVNNAVLVRPELRLARPCRIRVALCQGHPWLKDIAHPFTQYEKGPHRKQDHHTRHSELRVAGRGVADGAVEKAVPSFSSVQAEQAPNGR